MGEVTGSVTQLLRGLSQGTVGTDAQEGAAWGESPLGGHGCGPLRSILQAAGAPTPQQVGILFLPHPVCFQEVAEGTAFQELRTAGMGAVGACLFIIMKYISELVALS